MSNKITLNLPPENQTRAFHEWHRTELQLAARYALGRLDALDKLAADLGETEAFDSAFGIWKDFIRERTHEDEDHDVATLEIHGHVFARVIDFINHGDEISSLAHSAWGESGFSVHFGSGGTFGWFPDYGYLVSVVNVNPFGDGAGTFTVVTPEGKKTETLAPSQVGGVR